MRVGERVTLAWVRRYTRGLPAEWREERRAELESDLWEQVSGAQARGQRLGVTQAILLSRCARGAVADLSWRRRARPGRAPGIAWRLASRTMFVLCAVFLVVVDVAGSLPLIGVSNGSEDWSPGGAMQFARVCATLLVSLVGGLLVMGRHARTGAALASIGAVATATYMYWAWPFLGPAALVVTIGAVRVARRRPVAVPH